MYLYKPGFPFLIHDLKIDPHGPWIAFYFRGDTHMTSTWRGVGGEGKNEMLSDVGDGGLASVLDVQSSSFLIKENWICAVTRHDEPNMWSHPLMIPLHCLWAKSINRTRGEFECDLTWFCFCFGFVRSHVWCNCCSIFCLHFKVA